jgi:hypothetical protein
VIGVQLFGNAKAFAPRAASFADLVGVESPATAHDGEQIGVVFVVDYQLELGAKIRTRVISSTGMILKELVHLLTTSARRTEKFPLLMSITGNVDSFQTFNATVEYEPLEATVWQHSSNWQNQFLVEIVSETQSSSTARNSGSPPMSVLLVFVALAPILFFVSILLRRKIRQ